MWRLGRERRKEFELSTLMAPTLEQSGIREAECLVPRYCHSLAQGRDWGGGRCVFGNPRSACQLQQPVDIESGADLGSAEVDDRVDRPDLPRRYEAEMTTGEDQRRVRTQGSDAA